MAILRIALGQINPTVGDLEGNAQAIISYMQKAKDAGADVIAFPELAITGYPPEDLILKKQFVEDNIAIMKKLSSMSLNIAMIVGFVDQEDNNLFNAAAISHDGILEGVYHKILLPNYGVFDEHRYFKPGKICPIFCINGVNVGVNICEDIWYEMGPSVVQQNAGAEVIININGSPYQEGKLIERERMLSKRASDNQVSLAYVNTVGEQDELVFDGGSMVFDNAGKLVAKGKQFDEDLLIAELDFNAKRSQKAHSNNYGPSALKKIGTPKKINVSEYKKIKKPDFSQTISPTLHPLEEIYRALQLGISDYFRKTGFKKAVIGLSGGIDSSLTACIATNALGEKNVVGVAMPTRFSSESSVTDAKMLANNLGIEFKIISIDSLFSAYLSMLKPIFSNAKPDVTEENIQTRIRGNILMALSNKFNWLVLSTGNKSEYATGYCTLYGDMAGGFAVLKDIPKTLVYKLSGWRNESGEPNNTIPKSVMDKPPSAELSIGQTDQDTLPPYDILDGIIEAYVEQDQPYEEILASGFEELVTKKTIRLVDNSEYKRRQSPPGIKITQRAFGRDRRMPIVNKYPYF